MSSDLSELSLGVVTPELFPQWKRLRNSLYTGLDDTEHEREMAAILSAPDQACLVAMSGDGKLAGFVEVSQRNIVDGCDGSPVGYIEGLYVRSELRGQGVGRALVERAIEWFRQAGCREVASDAELDDTDAQAYWQRLGFEEVWRIVQYRKVL